MKISNLSLTTKLAAIHVLLAVSLVPLVGVAWWNLPTHEATIEVTQLERAQRATQNADMLHDALHADFLSALLATDASREERERIQRSMRENLQEFHADLLTLENAVLEEAVRKQVQASKVLALSYLQQVEHLVSLALVDPRAARGQYETFERTFETVKKELASQTALLAKRIDSAYVESKRATDNAHRWLLVAAFLTVIGSGIGVALIARSIRASLMQVRDVAHAVAGGDLKRRSGEIGSDEVGQIAASVNRMADALSQMIEHSRKEASRSLFSAQLTNALDVADSEQQACKVAARAMAQISPLHAMELLLSDSSNAHMERAISHPTMGPAGCGVDSPFNCTAVRRGHSVSFEHSEALDSCLHLQGRAETPVAATCVPITFMGKALGVLHAVGSIDESLSQPAREQLNTLGAQVGARIGTVRAFDSTQRQARTDSLTGLANRRAAEQRLRELLSMHASFALAMADLDHFKLLNDTHGHQAGDEALRLFSEVARENLRQTDMACRWGGEEFAFVLTNSDAQQAKQWADRVRERLERALRLRSLPVFTVSFGVVDTVLALPLESMVAAADVALYKAKSEGRDRVVCAQRHDLEVMEDTIRHAEPGAAINMAMLAEAPSS